MATRQDAWRQAKEISKQTGLVLAFKWPKGTLAYYAEVIQLNNIRSRLNRSFNTRQSKFNHLAELLNNDPKYLQKYTATANLNRVLINAEFETIRVSKFFNGKTQPNIEVKFDLNRIPLVEILKQAKTKKGFHLVIRYGDIHKTVKDARQIGKIIDLLTNNLGETIIPNGSDVDISIEINTDLIKQDLTFSYVPITR